QKIFYSCLNFFNNYKYYHNTKQENTVKILTLRQSKTNNITNKIVNKRKFYYCNILTPYKKSSENRFCRFFTILLFTSSSSTFSNPNSTFKEATALPRIPQGIMLSK